MGPEDRRVTRLIVPVTENTYCSFLDRFNCQSGFAYVNFDQGSNHLALGMRAPVNGKPPDCYLWARNYNGSLTGRQCNGQIGPLGDSRGSFMKFNEGGFIIPLNLQGPRIQHLGQWLAARESQADMLFCQGNCMEWLPNAEVAPGRGLFHEIGIRRSRDGRNMKAKILHAANQCVDVVGYFVTDVNRFNQLSDADLLGPPPGGGVTDAAR